MIVALTGCIGSGKSFYLNKIKEIYNYPIFDADKIAKEAYNEKEIINKLKEEFNCVIDNKIDFTLLKSQLNENNITKLNAIIHPYVKEKIVEIRNNYPISFVEVALLYESHMENLFDLVIAISIDDKLRHKRLKKRDNTSYEYMVKLEALQYDNFNKIKNADYVINSTDDDLINIERLKTVIEEIKKRM
ncbi:MAG: dephospho-CoA kinase [Candidatus Caccosoma sp.]|nr:dephospho-CoA kinase [Candidatus Caccosoma sp.]